MKKLFLGLIMLFAFTYAFSQVEGTWKVASQPGSLGVGPNQGDISWWAIDAAGIVQRDCFFDDKFVFNSDGSFNNVMENNTWLEAWQGVAADECGTPVFPHDGSNPATWAYDAGAGTLTLNGTGAHLGIPKVINGGEITAPDQAPASITYIVTEISATAMTIDIEISGGWWRFMYAKEAASGEDASLSDLKVDGTTIDGFSPGVTDYTYGLPEGTSDVPQITSATTTDPAASSLITQASAIPGDATVVVTSGNGAVTMTYTVSYVITTELLLPVTFDNENLNYDLIDFGGNASEIIVDPSNAENMIAKSIKTAAAELWAGTTVGGTAGFAVPIPFAEGATTMTVAVWSPTANTPIRLKVEDSNDPTKSVETETNTTVAEAWEVITFDFANEAPGTEPIHFEYNFNKASIFFNFGTDGATAGEQTYFWDDMYFGGGSVEPKPYLASDVQDNFENDGWGTITTWQFQDPDLMDITISADPMNANNNVLDYNRSGGFEWTNAQCILAHRMDLTSRNMIEVMAYFPSSNNYTGELTPTLALKLQNSLLGGGAWETQTEVKLTVDQFDAWVPLVFDFSVASDRDDYDQLVVQFGGEGHLTGGQFYLDDLKLQGGTSIFEQQTSKLQIFPNPATSTLSISGSENMKSLAIYNLTGQIVLQQTQVSSQINVSNLPSGLYTIVATDIDDEKFTSKLMIK